MKQMKISLIVALDDKNGIGKDGGMPWNIPSDLKRFKKITEGHPVIMGRKTFESIGKPLPKRTNIIITRNNFKQEDLIVKHSLKEAIEEAKKAPGSDEVFIVGGGQVFKEAIELADKIYLTKIEGDYNTDTFFPDYSQLNKVTYEQEGEDNGFRFKFIDLEKN